MHLLFASALLLGVWSAGVAHAEGKTELVEMPIKKRKTETASGPVTEASTPAAPEKQEKAEKSEKPEKDASESVKQLRRALAAIGTPIKQPEKPEATEKSGEAGSEKPVTKAAAKRPAVASHAAMGHVAASPANEMQSSRQYTKARALALAQGLEAGHAEAPATHGADVHWAYEGDNGPQNWAKLKPEFSLCGTGKRQSPIAIQSDTALQGPAEPLVFNYMPSRGTVVNTGHTVQVDIDGDNSLTVRGSTYKLLQFHFHTPSEEMVNARRYAMVAHLVHKNEAGQLAVVAVLLEQGEPSSFIDKVWTYMPLDTMDKVRTPDGLLDINELLPKDQRYYQYFGSLTTPPCTEGVLWMVLKQPVKISAAQYRLFRQQFPLNARPIQPTNGRPVRDAQ